ncbi:MAG: acyltransferase [Alteromonadaceae bacterium]|nr:MAG: acyltransferase [Alteromonadaceae bacterium]
MRAVAILSVIAFHAFPDWLKGGFVGVDIFFVISGFLISTIIFENLDRGTFSFSEFYSRRIKRIFPALILVLIACFVFGWFALLVGEYEQLGKHMAAGTMFVSNFVLWGEAGYFDGSAEAKPLLHLWSLAIEEQFYIVWPVLLWLAWKWKVNFLAITILIAGASFYLNMRGVNQDSVAAFFSPQTRFWELLSGSLLAWVSLYRKDACASVKVRLSAWLSTVFKQTSVANGKALSNVISFAGLSLLVCGFLTINKELSFPGLWALMPVLGAVLVILAGSEAWVNRVVLSNRIVVWVGLISYPLYLWHWPLLSFARIMEGEVPSESIRITAVVLSFVLAWLTYRFVEQRIRFGGEGKSKVIVLVAMMVVIGGLGFSTMIKGGWASRYEDESAAIQAIMALPLPFVNGTDCGKHIPEFKENNIVFNGPCLLTQDAPPSLAFVGDSHLLHYLNGIWGSFTSESVLMVVQWSCLPFAGDHFLTGDCKKNHDALTRYLESSSSVKTVVLSAHWAYLMSGVFEPEGDGWRMAKPFTEAGAKSFQESGINMITKLVNGGKQVVFMKDVPDLGFSINDCFDVRPFRLSPFSNFNQDCSHSQQRYLERIAAVDAVVEEMLSQLPSVKVYDPRSLFCSNGKCKGKGDFLPYYMDGDHLNHHGASMVMKDLIDKVDLNGS